MTILVKAEIEASSVKKERTDEISVHMLHEYHVSRIKVRY